MTFKTLSFEFRAKAITSFFFKFQVYDARLQFFLTWPEILQSSTSFSVGWSYIVAWIGVGLALISSIAYSAAAISIRSELRGMKKRAETMFNIHTANAICQHPQLFHPQFIPRPSTAQSYLGGSQMSLNHPEMPPMPMHGQTSGYYSVGYPTMHNVYNDASDTRTLQYKSVVKELEDAKL